MLVLSFTMMLVLSLNVPVVITSTVLYCLCLVQHSITKQGQSSPLVEPSTHGPILITAYQVIPRSRFSVFIVVQSHDSILMVVLETWKR